jgi:hypothetical protein
VGKALAVYDEAAGGGRGMHDGASLPDYRPSRMARPREKR